MLVGSQKTSTSYQSRLANRLEIGLQSSVMAREQVRRPDPVVSSESQPDVEGGAGVF